MDIVAQLKRIFTDDGVSFHVHDEQVWFAMKCGPFRASFRIFQNGFLVVLVATTDFTIPDDRIAAVAEFCGYANYALLVCCDVEVNPDDANVVVRHSLMVPSDGVIDDDQLRWLIAASAGVLANIARPIVTLASGKGQVMTVLSEERAKLYAAWKHPDVDSVDGKISAGNA